MGQAAYTKKVRVSTDQATWHDVPTDSPTLNLGGEVLDDTDLSNSSTGFRSRLLGLHDWSVNCDSNFKTGNTALSTIRSAFLNRTVLYVQYLPDGVIAGGFQGKVVVENFNLGGEVAGKETVGITLQANGALADAS